ncbi:MAG: sigma-70 family RNA polymerase sigma factor [Saprospiraceae bacterium]
MAQDVAWISKMLLGDRKAILYFVDTYGQFMYHVCYKILLSIPDAEEATQDATMKAINGIEKFDQSASLKAWCYTIAYRTAIDYKRKMQYPLPLDHTNDMAIGISAEQNIITKETKSSIDTLLSHLDEESRMIVDLYYLEEQNIKEVAFITGLTESNIKIKLFRARKTLAQYADKYSELINQM